MRSPTTIFCALLVALFFMPVPVRPAEAAVILFDQGHGQRFVVGESGPLQLSILAGLFREGGARVTTQSGTLTEEALAATDALVLSGPFAPYSPAEIDAIAGFIERGGRVAVMVHIAPPLGDLLYRLGIDFSNGVIRERENTIAGDPQNFRATRFVPHPLIAGVRHFSLYGAWALMNTGANATIIARTSPDAWIDLNGDRVLSPGDAVQSFGVAVAGRLGLGEFAVFGDDAIFQNKFLDEENRLLARNLAAWLVNGK